MSACISANSVIYLLIAGLLVFGIRRYVWNTSRAIGGGPIGC
jgi:hypothetical protein